jgi:tRNA(adenine34) deaminase
VHELRGTARTHRRAALCAAARPEHRHRDARAAALREALEETGYHVRLRDEPALVARAPFTWNGVLRDVTTHYFRADLIGDRGSALPVHDADFNEGVVWVPRAAIDRELGFDATILASVQALLAG